MCRDQSGFASGNTSRMMVWSSCQQLICGLRMAVATGSFM